MSFPSLIHFSIWVSCFPIINLVDGPVLVHVVFSRLDFWVRKKNFEISGVTASGKPWLLNVLIKRLAKRVQSLWWVRREHHYLSTSAYKKSKEYRGSMDISWPLIIVLQVVSTSWIRFIHQRPHGLCKRLPVMLHRPPLCPFKPNSTPQNRVIWFTRGIELFPYLDGFVQGYGSKPPVNVHYTSMNSISTLLSME